MSSSQHCKQDMQSQDRCPPGFEPLPDSSAGNRYKRIRLDGHARAHLGDYYVGTVNHYGSKTHDVGLDPAAKQQMILEHLYHADMERRSMTIHNLDDTACDWAFDPSRISLAPWLEQEGGIFWITGKAGSGKSTFMKFLARHPVTRNLLAAWAGVKRLIVAEHYFWYSTANGLQKNFEGMLRGLLYTVLCEMPDIIPSLLPSRWAQASHRLRSAWTEAELLQALCGLGALQDARFAFFLDGLDECVPSRDHGTLVRHLEQIARSSNVKLCVSSRPWQTFETHFGVLGNRLALHEYTFADMVSYISSKLIEVELDTGLRRCFADHQTHADRLVLEIAQKAEGVFLWTVLTVKVLCEEIEAGRSVEDLHCYLEETSVDLKKFFTTMILERIDHHNQLAVARFLKCTTLLARASAASQGTWHMWFLNFLVLSQSNEAQEQDFASQADLRPLYLEDMQTSLQQTRRYIGRMSRDLLHIPTPREAKLMNMPTDNVVYLPFLAEFWVELASSRVEFLHRAVFDYLLDTDIESLLDQHVPGHFRNRDLVARITLARIKLYPKLRLRDAFPHLVPPGSKDVYVFENVGLSTAGWALQEREELQTYLCGTPFKQSMENSFGMEPYFDQAAESLSYLMVHKQPEAPPPYDVDCCKLAHVCPNLVAEYEDVALLWAKYESSEGVRKREADDFLRSLVSYGLMRYVRHILPFSNGLSALAMIKEAISTLICYPTASSHASTLSTLLEDRQVSDQWLMEYTTEYTTPNTELSGWWPMILSCWAKLAHVGKLRTPQGDLVYSEEMTNALEDHIFEIASTLCQQGHDVFEHSTSMREECR